MKIYIARHGQTDWNQERRAQGRTDTSLNAAGREQARELREKIKDMRFDAVYSSPLSRAHETAKIATGEDYDIICDDRLIERSFGDFEGKIILGSWSNMVGGINIDDIKLNEIPGNIEPVKNLLMRIENFVNFLRENYPQDANILIFSHGAMAKAFDWYLGQHDENYIYGDLHLKNVELKSYEV